MQREIARLMDIMKTHGCVSIIVPVYNTKKYLREAIDSVVHQTYNNIEVIIIDDGSTDGSGDICDEYAQKDERFFVIHQENRGLSSARNAGLDIMTGDAVVFLDADDALHPEFVSRMWRSMVVENADLAICKYFLKYTEEFGLCDSKKKIIKPLFKPGLYYRTDALRTLVDAKFNHDVWNKMYCASLWEDIRFPDGHVYEDVSVTYKLLDKSQRVIALADPLYSYRIHPDSITGQCNKEKIEDGLMAIEQYHGFIRNNIPALFSYEQLKKSKQIHLIGLMGNYLRLLCRKQGDTVLLRKQLAGLIVSLGNDVGIPNSNILFRVCYWMIRFTPGLLELLYPAYLNARNRLRYFESGIRHFIVAA